MLTIENIHYYGFRLMSSSFFQSDPEKNTVLTLCPVWVQSSADTGANIQSADGKNKTVTIRGTLDGTGDGKG